MRGCARPVYEYRFISENMFYILQDIYIITAPTPQRELEVIQIRD